MPLIGLAPGFGDRPAPNPYLNGGGRGIGNTNPGLAARPPTPRHPEGGFIPQGRGIWEKIFGPGQIKVPLGGHIDRRDIQDAAMPRFSIVSPVPVFIRSEASPTTIAGGRAPQNREVLQVISAPAPLLPPVRSSPIPGVGVGLPTEIKGVETVSDITHFLRDLLPGGSDIFDMGANVLNIFGSSNPAPTQLPAPAPQQLPTTQSGGGMLPPTGGGGIRVGCERDPAEQYVLKFTCGEWKWVKKRKRRRKRLATSSDIKDLSSLKGVLGGGKSFDLWIATHA